MGFISEILLFKLRRSRSQSNGSFPPPHTVNTGSALRSMYFKAGRTNCLHCRILSFIYPKMLLHENMNPKPRSVVITSKVLSTVCKVSSLFICPLK